jgi:hypothetical protein
VGFGASRCKRCDRDPGAVGVLMQEPTSRSRPECAISMCSTEEPLPEAHPFTKMANVILTPYLGWPTKFLHPLQRYVANLLPPSASHNWRENRIRRA